VLQWQWHQGHRVCLRWLVGGHPVSDSMWHESESTTATSANCAFAAAAVTRWRLVSAASLPSLLSSTDPQASGRNGRGAPAASDAGPRLLRSLVSVGGWKGGGRGLPLL
jgi:hypothetical protein